MPLAIPLVAGPSGMAAVMLMGSNEPAVVGLELCVVAGLEWSSSDLIFCDVLVQTAGPSCVDSIGALNGNVVSGNLGANVYGRNQHIPQSVNALIAAALCQQTMEA